MAYTVVRTVQPSGVEVDREEFDDLEDAKAEAQRYSTSTFAMDVKVIGPDNFCHYHGLVDGTP